MKNYFRIMLGGKSIHAEECFKGGFIGTDFGLNQDLKEKLPDEWREFNKEFIPVIQKIHPQKTKIGAGLACGAIWTVSKGIQKGDIVLCPDGTGRYLVGEVTGDYYYEHDGILPHRRAVQWLNVTIDRPDMSDALKKSTNQGTVSNISGYHEEIENLIGGHNAPKLISNDATIEDPSAFAMEMHLEDFLVKNWAHTELGKKYDIYEEDGEKVGKQYPTDTGPLDILAISKDKKELLVVELKKGRASDVVVGQILRYMGFVKEELSEKNQTVKGVIIALDDHQRIRRALVMVPNIDFYRYQIHFNLVKV